VEFIEKLMLLPYPQELGYVGIFELLIQFHISFGLISLITGSAILALTKGSRNHKMIGRVFVVVMMGNFMLGVPLGSFGQLVVGEPASVMTVVGALFVGAVTFSGYRVAKAGANAGAWYDKAMLALQLLAALLYLYVALLMIFGTSLLGLTALTMEGQQFTLLDNKFYLFEDNVQLVSTTGGTVFAIIICENFLTPLFLSALAFWLSYQDWIRIMGTKKIPRTEIIQQHLTRLLLIFSVAITAVLLNANLISFWLDWSLPLVCALGLALYFKVYGYNRRSSKAPNTVRATA